MSEEPLAHKNQPPSSASDAEYDSIYAAVAETAQGRRFLEEHMRRSRPDETEAGLAPIRRMQTAMGGENAGGRLDLFLLEVAEMAQAIARTRAEIVAIKPPQQRLGQIDDAMEELDSIVQTTESATSRILAAAEQMQEITWTLRERGMGEDFCGQLDAQATEIYTACSFQDLTGQRTRKVIQVLRYLEDRINAMVGIWGKEKSAAQAAADDPCITGSLAQADVDVVMQPEASVSAAEEDRQDATLEDINRFMLALEPLMALHQAGASEKSAEQLAAAQREEVRPELSVAATVMQEVDDARQFTEWAAEDAPPQAQAKPEPALKQEAAAEPAWMALQRLQMTPDFPQPEAGAGPSEPAAANEPVATAPTEEIAAPPPPLPLVALERAGPAKPLPILSIAPAQDDVIARLIAMLPPAELNFPKARAKPSDPPDELAAAITATKIALLRPELPPAPEPRAAEIAPAPIEAPPPTTAMREEATTSAAPDIDADEFLFAPEPEGKTKPAPPPETRHEEPGPADFLLAPAPPEKASDAPPRPLPVTEWKGGSFPDPALVTPHVVPASALSPLAARLAARMPYDPLAPLRALSDEEKIALFS